MSYNTGWAVHSGKPSGSFDWYPWRGGERERGESDTFPAHNGQGIMRRGRMRDDEKKRMVCRMASLTNTITRCHELSLSSSFYHGRQINGLMQSLGELWLSILHTMSAWCIILHLGRAMSPFGHSLMVWICYTINRLHITTAIFEGKRTVSIFPSPPLSNPCVWQCLCGYMHVYFLLLLLLLYSMNINRKLQ